VTRKARGSGILSEEVSMTSEYIEERNGGYYVAGTRISLDSVVYSFERGNSPEAIQKEYPLLKLSQIYGAIAFYLDHQEDIRSYLEAKEHHVEASSTPLAEANPELWARLEHARQSMGKSER
jgi:uncharacterized protein (DUF433 family)